MKDKAILIIMISWVFSNFLAGIAFGAIGIVISTCVWLTGLGLIAFYKLT